MTRKTKNKSKGKKMPPIAKVTDQNELVSAKKYPFATWHFENFNPVQSRVFDYYTEDANTLIAARTSAGKTVVSEMFLAHEIRKRGGKGMFLAPLRALAQEKIDQWTDLQYHFKDLKISICTGDYRLTKERAKELAEADMIIMTSEMLNHRSRNFKSEQNNWLLDVGTLCIDECLPPNAMIETDRGLIPIGEIIDKNLDVKVVSFNHKTNKVEYRKIIARQKKLLKRRWHTLYYMGGHISVTSNHLVWCESRGYIPSKDIKEGDFIYVRRINSKRKTSNIGDFAGRRFDSSSATRKISKIESSTVFGPKGFSRVEVQRVETTGWHPSTNQAEQRVRKGNMQIRYLVEQNAFGNTFDVLSTREEDSEFSMVGRDHRSCGIGGVVHGRWKSGSKHDGNSYRGLSQIRSGIVSELVGNEMVGGLRSVSDQTILATQISSEGSGSFSRTGSPRNNFRHELQIVAKNGANILLDVWSRIHSRSSQYSHCQKSHALREQELPFEVGQDVQSDGSMDSEESWCCDLEIEADCFEDCNFFADGVLVHNSHLLTVPGRGDHLEVGLMKFTEINPKARIVLLSATMPNVDQIAEWVSYSLTKKQTYVLNSEYRPVPLNIHYEIYDDSPRRYDQIEENKVEKALEIIGDWYPDDKFLVFAHTKRTGEMMKTALRGAGIKAEFHNADLDKDSRIKLERDFKTDKSLRVVVATPTLAWGCYAKGTPVLMADGTIKEIEKITPGEKVFANSESGFVPKTVLKTGPKQVSNSLEFVLSSGEKVTVSSDHRFYGAIGRNTPDYSFADKFSVGDLLAVPDSIEIFSNVESDDLGYLAGYVMGDGCKCKCGYFADKEIKTVLDIAFSSKEVEHAEYVNCLIEKYFGSKMKSRFDSNGVYHLISKKRSITSRFAQPLPGRNKNILSMSSLKRKDASYIRGVIQGLFDTDGGFSWHGNDSVSLEFTTISEKLAKEVQQYLLFFGIRSSVGKKKMKSSIINGRFQKSKRNFIYRVRIYNTQVFKFLKNIGFRNVNKKTYGDYISKQNCFFSEKNIVPVRALLKDHAEKNGISVSKMCNEVGVDLWSSLYKKDLKYDTCQKIINKFPKSSDLTKLISRNIRFSKIVSISPSTEQELHDIEVEGEHNYVGGGIVSHNCNLPARRVIILGVHRGIQEVETYNITQMVGRSGRLGIDPAGDAYILVPESQEEMWRKKLQKPQKIESQLLEKEGEHHKVLAFHLVSEVHHGYIKTNEDVHRWYERSLAYFQDKNLHERVVDDVMELLKDKGCLKFEDDTWKITSVGMIASMFYFSPFDVADLRNNFWRLFTNNQQDNDYYLAMALANTDTNRSNIVSRAEKEEMSLFANRVRNLSGPNYTYPDPVIKAGYCYFNLLSGNNSANLAAIQRNFQFDYPRLSQVLLALDSMSGKWEQSGYLHTLEDRIRNGVPAHLVNLCRIPNVGKVRAKKLFDYGIKSVDEFAEASEEKLRKLLNLKEDVVKGMLAEANKLSLTSS